MQALFTWVAIIAFIVVQMALVAVAGIHRDGWQGWRHFWF